MSEGKTKELVVDMPESGEMRSEALRMAKLVTENNKIESKIAEIIKKHFDEKYGPNWHCIVGKSFHAHSSYEAKHYMFFYEGPLAILLYKMG